VRAAQLWSVTEVLGQATGMEQMTLNPTQKSYDGWLADARAAVGARAFADAWAQGRALSLDEATAEALLEQEPDGSATPAR
jgi:hypothetical protein